MMARTGTRSLDANCPCGGGVYRRCCGPLHDTGTAAASPLQVMRARYSAYALGRMDFLKTTWHPKTCPFDLGAADPKPRQWLGLEVRDHSCQDDQSAMVEFVARYRIAGRAYRLHERSRFVRHEAHWVYLDGALLR